MSLVVTQYPHAAVNGKTSKWNAVHHPINYIIARRDQEVQLRFSNTNNQYYIKVINPINASATVGGYVQYFDLSGNHYTFLIIGIVGDVIEVQNGLTGTSSGGYVNYLSRTDYYLETEILNVNESLTYISLGRMRHTTAIDGSININVATWLKSLATYPNDFEYNAINKAMFYEGGRYALRFVEYYDGRAYITGQLFPIDFWTNSAKQPGDVHGSNMGEYVPTYDATRPVQSLFMTTFERLTYFEGYPFSLSFIYSDNIGFRNNTREEERFDINGASLSTSSDALSINERWNVNRLMIEEGYSSSVDYLEVWIDAGSEITTGNPIEAAEEAMSAYTDGSVFKTFPEFIETEAKF